MPRGVYERKPKEPDNMVSPDNAVSEQKLFPVVLNKNYVPSGKYEVIGYLKEAVKRKDAAGNWKIIEKEEFVNGAVKPHPSPGVGYAGKIWAGTHIRLPLDEAKAVIAKKMSLLHI